MAGPSNHELDDTRARQRAAEQARQLISKPTEQALIGSLPARPYSLLGACGGCRGASPVRAAAMHTMQRTYGNRAVQRSIMDDLMVDPYPLSANVSPAYPGPTGQDTSTHPIPEQPTTMPPTGGGGTGLPMPTSGRPTPGPSGIPGGSPTYPTPTGQNDTMQPEPPYVSEQPTPGEPRIEYPEPEMSPAPSTPTPIPMPTPAPAPPETEQDEGSFDPF